MPVELVDVYPTIVDLLRAPFNRKKVCSGGTVCLKLSGKSLAPVVLGDELYRQHFLPISSSSSGKKRPLAYYLLSNKTRSDTMLTRFTKNLLNTDGTGAAAAKTNSASGSRLVSTDIIHHANYTTAMPLMKHDFALSQTVRCAPANLVPKSTRDILSEVAGTQAVSTSVGTKQPKMNRAAIWNDCDINNPSKNEISLMGYGMRTPDYRYIVYFHYAKKQRRVDFNATPFAEELYDHRNETLADFTHRELSNLSIRPAYSGVIQRLRQLLIKFVKLNVPFHKE